MRLPQPVPQYPEHLAELVAELPPVLKFHEVQRTLRISDRSLRRLLANRELKFMRSSRSGSSRVLVTRSEVIRWLTLHSVG